MYYKSTELTFTVVALDNGDPQRGTSANITVTLGNSCLINYFYKPIEYNVIVEETTGEIYLRIPKYYSSSYGKFVMRYITL